MTDIDLSKTDRAILDLLADGRNVPSNLADDLDLSRQHIQKRLKRLEEHGYVQNIGRGVYERLEESSE
ncbi:MAG: winged helix-turn-helix transcriptional regulator [Halobacteriota archaeon]